MEFKEAVKTALENEKKGRQMYLEFVENAQNNVTKKTFEYLAGEELRHIEKIKEIAGTLGSDDIKVPDLGEASLDDMKRIFGVAVKEFDSQIEPNSDDIEAHKMAMDFEKKSSEYYRKLAEETADENMKLFFNALTDEEDKHYELIEKAYYFISNPEGFYSEEEGWLLEG